MAKKLTMKKVVDLLDKTYDLVYVDYRDSLDDNLDVIQEAIQKQDICVLDEAINQDRIWDSQYESVEYILKNNLPDEIVRAYDVEEEDAEEFIEEHWEDLRYEIEDRDRSNPLNDLLRNTDNPVIFYDTGVEIEESWINDGFWDNFNEGIYERTLPLIKSVLDIQDDKYDKDLLLMLQQASYGGRLVIYFREDVRDLIDLKGANVITFKSPMVAIINTYNGSGDHTDLPKHEFSLPFDPANLFLDKTIKYSYTYEVCGMYSSWCDSTSVSFSTSTVPVVAGKSSLHTELDVEKIYKEAYQAGGCTFGDMDMKRHRDIFYLNEYPCGIHCPHCGTFWID